MTTNSPEAISREAARSRRKRAVRARTVSVKRISKPEIDRMRRDHDRPRTRGECKHGIRPCPFVSCKHNLYIDVSLRTGAYKLNFPDLEPHQMLASCALDVADRGGSTLEEIGDIMNLTRERIRQIEVKALKKLRDSGREIARARELWKGPDAEE